IECVEGCLLFLDAPGGTGKTFLINLLSAQTQKDKKVAIAVASSGIAATLLDDGRTAHSVLQLPLNLAMEKHQFVTLLKIVSAVEMCQHCKLLIWDECTLSNKIDSVYRSIEALNRTMKDINNNQSIMGRMEGIDDR
ncbi:hypothetical protein AVEN_235539-1, partial [Araneus ventricosus]